MRKYVEGFEIVLEADSSINVCYFCTINVVDANVPLLLVNLSIFAWMKDNRDHTAILLVWEKFFNRDRKWIFYLLFFLLKKLLEMYVDGREYKYSI